MSHQSSHSFSLPQELRLNLDRNIKQLSDFKIVMSTINSIQSTTLSVELKIKEMQETFNVLEEHRIQVSPSLQERIYYNEKCLSRCFHLFHFHILLLGEFVKPAIRRGWNEVGRQGGVGVVKNDF